MTDYLKIKEAFFACQLDLYELEALKGLVDAEIREELKQIEFWTIAGKYRLDLRDQFSTIKLALEKSGYRVSVDRPTHCPNCCIKWCLRKPGAYYGDLQLRSDGSWATIARSGSSSSIEPSLTELVLRLLSQSPSRYDINTIGWKLAS